MKFKIILVSLFTVASCLAVVGCSSKQNTNSNYSNIDNGVENAQNNVNQHTGIELPEHIFSSEQNSISVNNVNPSENRVDSENMQSSSYESNVVENFDTQSQQVNSKSNESNHEESNDASSSEIEQPINQDGEIELPDDVWD